MRKIIIFLISLFILSSCADIITIVDKKIYYDYDALIAYDWYNELYKNDSVNYNKPIMFRINKIKKESEIQSLTLFFNV